MGYLKKVVGAPWQLRIPEGDYPYFVPAIVPAGVPPVRGHADGRRRRTTATLARKTPEGLCQKVSVAYA